jgi:3-isopropylmalate dehydrogenase
MRVLILPGDGIGPEISASTLEVLTLVDRRFSLGLSFETHEIGLVRLNREGSTLPQAVLEAARAADGIVVGPVSNLDYPPPDRGGINISAELRTKLDLFANIRPARSRQGLPHYGRTPIDLVIMRENTEGFYADRNMHAGSGEWMPTPDLALSMRKITAQGSRRIARAGFELARSRRRKVTAVHKVNVLKMTEGLFLREVRDIAKGFPDVDYNEQLVDSMAALLVRDAQRFDVVVTTNMFGDILSDEATELSGSLGLGAAINAGETHCMAQAQHGSAPDLAGLDRANPSSLVLSAAMLLDWIGRTRQLQGFARAAAAIEQSVDALVKDPATRTADLGGPLGTRAFTAALCAQIGHGLG